MFSSLKVRIILAIYILLILSIPIGAYLVSQQKTFKSRASEETTDQKLKASPKPRITNSSATSSAKQLLNALNSSGLSTSTESESSSPTIATSFGPTLNLKVKLEGRPENNQSIKLFIGIVEGSLSANPKFLLNFSVNLPVDGTYSNLSLAGMSVGTKYTALVKGAAQIASSSEFTMSPNVTDLNEGNTIILTTGDLNEDNTINSADYSIVKGLLGKTKTSSNWNENADLNKDGVINSLDLLIVSNNLGKTGASGIWVSPLNKTATSSGALTEEAEKLPVGSTLNGSDSGYWIRIPK